MGLSEDGQRSKNLPAGQIQLQLRGLIVPACPTQKQGKGRENGDNNNRYDHGL